jgi:ectoine hydroxylase-related dioxygenase (phytanoyl-CoA dioxygenase family)
MRIWVKSWKARALLALSPVAAFHSSISGVHVSANYPSLTQHAVQLSTGLFAPAMDSVALPSEERYLDAGQRADDEARAEGVLFEIAPHLPWPAPSTEALLGEGVVYVLNTVSAATAAALRVHCEAKLADNLAAIASAVASYSACFGTVRARTARHDLKLSLDPVVAEALAEALCVLGPMLRETLGCPEPYLAALGAVGSTKGAPRQLMHADTRCFDAPELLTMFVALQDVDEVMGPTTFVPGTHNSQAHAAMLQPSRKAELLRAGPIRLGAMPLGASTLYDTRLLHGGGANRSPRGRWLFYATFAASRSIAAEYHGREYTELQRAVHTVGSLQRSVGSQGDLQTEAGQSDNEGAEWEGVWAALAQQARGK